MDEPEAIRRLMERLGVSKDKATVLLVMNGWNEHKLNANYLLSAEYAIVSSHFVTNPEFNTTRRRCDFCLSNRMCQNMDCGHYLCGPCFVGEIESKILEGNLIVLCPRIACGKIVSNTWILRNVSAETKIIYDINLRASQPPTSQATLWKKAYSFMKRTGTSFLDTSRVELEKYIFHMILAAVLKKIVERRN